MADFSTDYAAPALVSFQGDRGKLNGCRDRFTGVASLILDVADVEIAAFNCYAATAFPEVFTKKFPSILANCGGSIWLRTIS